MQCPKLQSVMLSLALLFSGNVGVVSAQSNLEAARAAAAGERCEHFRNFDECSQCCNILSVSRLCASKVKAKCVDADQVNADEVCAETVRADNGCFNKVSGQEICVGSLQIPGSICAGSIRTPTLCAGDLTANNMCVAGTIRANNVESCNNFKATMAFTSDTVYSLGDNIDWDAILEDPNGDVTLNPTQYHVPRSGWYIVSLQVDQSGLLSTLDPILGVPVGNAIITVNGAPFRQAYSPYLTFSAVQNTTFTSLMTLHAGDVVAAMYKVLAIDPATGAVSLVGTVTVDGTGTEENKSVMKIHYLSSDCTDLPCAPCSFGDCQTMCDMCDSNCGPCHAHHGGCHHHSHNDGTETRTSALAALSAVNNVRPAVLQPLKPMAKPAVVKPAAKPAVAKPKPNAKS